MGTNANIAVKIGNTVVEVSVNFDGYPGHVRPLLLENYNSLPKALNLVSKGDLSELAASPELANGHSFDNRIEGHCVYYGRDRGEPQDHVDPDFIYYDDYKNNTVGDYEYLFDGTWKYRYSDTETAFVELSSVIVDH